jgi:DUF177 domain-containing protein
MTPLRIDVADLLHRSSARRPVRVEAQVTGLTGSAATVPEGQVVRADLELERIPDGIVVQGTLQTAWRAQCSRCLADLEGPLELWVTELFEPEPVEGETYPIEGHEIDLEQLVRDTVLLELPAIPVCDGECAEVPVEGPEPPPDPRWAALAEVQFSPIRQPNQKEH